jgi:hypothetical protein
MKFRVSYRLALEMLGLAGRKDLEELLLAYRDKRGGVWGWNGHAIKIGAGTIIWGK